MATVWKKLIIRLIYFSFFFIYINKNNFAMPEVGTTEEYILKAHTKF